MVMQRAVDFLVGGSNPGRASMPPPPPPLQRAPTRIQTTDHRCCVLLRYHSTNSCVWILCFPTAWSLVSENF